MTLYVIEGSLEQLAEARELAEGEGDSEAIKVIDAEIESYLTKEAAKVDSYAGLIRRRISEAELCKAEAQRLLERAKAAQDDVDRLKQTAVTVMERFGVRELKTPTNTLRVQANGGLQPLEITPGGIPRELREVTVVMRALDWDAIEDAVGASLLKWKSFEINPDNQAIREALTQRLPCPECANLPAHEPIDVCPRCNGVGTVPNAVPGARLLERGKHVRVL